MRSLSKVLARTALVATVLVGSSVSVHADIVINGSDEFIASVEAALEKMRMAGGPSKANLEQLEMSSRDHVISENCGLGSSTPSNTGDSKSKDAGGTGKGSGTSVKWDPDHAHTYKDGVDRNPCAALAHELSHAADADSGTRDPRPDPASGVKNTEIRATGEENQFRKAQKPPLPPRTKYGCKDLPESAVCPPHLDEPHDQERLISSLFSTLDLYSLTPSPAVAAPAPVPLATVVLTGAASSSTYQAGDPVVINLALTNRSGQAVTVSPIVEGNVRVLSLTRDGVDVPYVSAEIDLEDGHDHYLTGTMVSLAAGARIDLNAWHSQYDETLGGEALGSPTFSNSGIYMIQLHSLTDPGNYELMVTYQYAGPTTGIPVDTFTRRTNNASIKFTVQ
ncbi:MAG: hypothetical protein KDD11_22610 [Acidobacteria bacterium]|nr:hypothetical protein [Acidobacteriota bacterium]